MPHSAAVNNAYGGTTTVNGGTVELNGAGPMVPGALVINAGGTKREQMQKAHALLKKVNAPLIGAVLNNVKFDNNLHKYYGSEQ